MARKPREVESGLVIGLTLVDAGQPVLDRVFDGDDVLAHLRQLGQRCVERGRLPAAGRSGDEENAFGTRDETAHPHHAVERELQRRPVEQSEDRLFSPDGRVCRDAHIQAAAADRGAEPPVLRVPMLGDVHARQHFDAGDDSRGERQQQMRDLVKRAVDTEPHPETVLHRLQMHVTRAVRRGARDDAIDQRGGRPFGLLVVQIQLRTRHVDHDRLSGVFLFVGRPESVAVVLVER